MFVFLLLSFVAMLGFTSCNDLTANNKDYKAAIADNDFVKAHSILDVIRKEYEDTYRTEMSKETDKRNRETVIAGANELYTAVYAVYMAESKIIIASEEQDVPKRISFLLSDIIVLGEKIPAGTKFYPPGSNGYNANPNTLNFELYNIYVSTKNSICKSIYKLAAISGNKDLQKTALTNIEERVKIEKTGILDYHIIYDNTEKEKLEMESAL